MGYLRHIANFSRRRTLAVRLRYAMPNAPKQGTAAPLPTPLLA